ncbi:MAG: sulfatase [Planctomycetaceae bacterium]
MRNVLLLLVLVSATCGAADRPNILFAISDDQSFPHASAYGCKWVSTPGFDRVAKSGVLFTHAFAPTPGCSPTRASILTGRHAWQNREAGTHASSFPSDLPIFTELLQSAGYFVGSTGKGWGPGNYRISGRTEPPAGKPWGSKKNAPPVKGISRNDYASNLSVFLDDCPEDKPFCFWFGATEPHRNFEPIPNPTDDQIKDIEVPGYLPDVPQVRADLRAYAREVEWFDSHLVRMLDELQKRGELENTIVVVTSDNGMAFPRAKANVYEDGIHMPLAIAWPDRVPANRRSNDMVSLIDIAPTLLEAAGLEPSISMRGRSLLPILKSKESGILDPSRLAVFAARERHSSSRYKTLGYPQRAVRTRDFLYIRNLRSDRWPAGTPRKLKADGTPAAMHGGYHDIDACPTLSLMIANRTEPDFARCLALAVDRRPDEELYDIQADPGCLNNLADLSELKSQKVKLAAMLSKEMIATNDPRSRGEGDVFETYPRYSHLRRFPKPDWAKQNPEAVPKLPWFEQRTRKSKKQASGDKQ